MRYLRCDALWTSERYLFFCLVKSMTKEHLRTSSNLSKSDFRGGSELYTLAFVPRRVSTVFVIRWTPARGCSSLSFSKPFVKKTLPLHAFAMVKKIYIPQTDQGGIYKIPKESGEYPCDKMHSSKTELIIEKSVTKYWKLSNRIIEFLFSEYLVLCDLGEFFDCILIHAIKYFIKHKLLNFIKHKTLTHILFITFYIIYDK